MSDGEYRMLMVVIIVCGCVGSFVLGIMAQSGC